MIERVHSTIGRCLRHVSHRSHRTTTLALLTIAAILIGNSRSVPAQQGSVVQGTVRDEGGRPVENALVVLDARTDRRLTRTDSVGHFRFDDVRVGPHELATAFLRLVTDVRTIAVTPVGLELEIVLRANTALLDTVHILVQRTGVRGLVFGHEDIAPLGGADVRLMGTGFHATTGANGQFDFSDTKPGAYVIYVTRKGYQPRMLSVVVRRDSAIDLALAMDRTTANSEKRLGTVLFEFDRRRNWMSKPHSALVTRQELRGHTNTTLDNALRYSISFLTKGLVVDDRTCVYVNGLFQQYISVSDVPVDNIEAVEVYGTGADLTATVTYRNGVRPSRLPLKAICGRGEARSEMSMGLESEVKGALGFPGNTRLAGTRGDPARVEAIVVWTRP